MLRRGFPISRSRGKSSGYWSARKRLHGQSGFVQRASIQFKMFGLPADHGDPFDRMPMATALAEDVPIVVRDREFTKYKDFG
jgi:PIN domain nuclease of toxin-antitoxin system